MGFGKLVVFPFAKLGCPRVRPYVRWTLHIVAVIAILACLTWLNAVLDLDKVVRAPWQVLRTAWLPMLFMFIYSLAWVAWWLWRVATSPAEQSPYPELDQAWREGLQALEQAKIDLLQTPVYLFIGGAAERLEGLMQATGWTWDVPLTPKRPISPLRLCATRDAIFLDLSNASTAGAYTTRLLAQTTAMAIAQPVTVTSAAAHDDSAGGVATAVATRRTAQRGLELIEQSLALLEHEKKTQTETDPTLDGVRISDEELDASEARLAYVCHLLADVRATYCPTNGIITLI
ncbi:MAG TPA: hypothetical protein VM512_07985, partial [Burkholderiaceae bacterium]|nr:hypothetical protein [Burkholderiaceae bacterium]